MKKIMSIVLVFAMMLTVFTGCGDSKKNGVEDIQESQVITNLTEPVEIVIWHTLAEHHQAAFEKIISDYNASQDMITVVAKSQPYQDYFAKLMQAVRNGTGPDLVTAFPTEAVNYMDDDLLVDFAPYINNEEIGINNFKENISGELYGEITQWDKDSIYMIPALTTSEVLFYNKTIYDELNLTPPTTWKEVEDNSRIILQEKGIPGFGTDSIVDTYQGLIRQAGSDYIDPVSKTVKFNNEIGLEKLTWFADGVKEGIFRLVGEDTYFSNPFGSQAIASYVGSSAGVQYVLDAAADKFEVGCVQLPQSGPNKFISSWGSYYVGFKSTDEKAFAVYDFLKYLTSPDVLSSWAISFGAIPSFKDAQNTPEFVEYTKENIAVKALSESIENISYLNSILGSSSVRTHIDKMIQEVSMGLSDPQQALDECEKASNADLNQ